MFTTRLLDRYVKERIQAPHTILKRKISDNVNVEIVHSQDEVQHVEEIKSCSKSYEADRKIVQS